jgi:hypothetical protein
LAAVSPPIGATTERDLRETFLCAALAGAFAVFVVAVVPRGGDLAAHLYRTSLVSHGVLVWDNLWFAGQYPLASYSLLYYPLAALVGNSTLAVLGVVTAAGVFASIAVREWHSVGRWPARTFAVLLAGQVFTAAYPYDLGLSTLLGALWALQRKRLWLAVCCIAATLGISPLAFLFLALILLALFLRQRRLSRQALVAGGAVLAAGGVQLAVLAVAPSPGLVYPYGTWRLLVGLAVAGLGVVVSLRGRGGWSLASIFVVWAAATIVADLVPSPVGHNLIRASVFALPLMLVAAALADFRPRRLSALAIVAALAANVLPYAAMISDRSSGLASQATFWQPVVEFLRSHSGPSYRVEVVPTANHWEAYYLPRAGLPLARGWYRQLDIADNPALYAPRLTPADYRGWLRARGVRYVVLPHLPLEATDARREARLVRSPAAGLDEVFSSHAATIYELPRAEPILTGPGAATVTAMSSSEIDGRVARAGTYLLRVHFTPYWSIARGSLCLARTRGGMTLLDLRRAGPFSLHAIETPGGIVTAFLDQDAPGCRARRARRA